MQVVDAQGNWSGGQTHLISLGDLPRVGLGSRKIVDFLIQLQFQAEKVGGRVHVVLGDQELLSLTASTRHVFTADSSVHFKQTAICHPYNESFTTERVLKHFSADRVIIGHTRGNRVLSRMDGSVVAIITGESKSPELITEHSRSPAFKPSNRISSPENQL